MQNASVRATLLSPDQRDAFAEQGCLRLPGFLSRAQVEPVRRQVLDELKREKIWASGRTLSTQLSGLPAFQQIGRVSGRVKVPNLQQVLVTPELCAIVSAIAGDARVAPAATQLLLSLPHQGTWTLAGLNWHLDLAAGPSGGVPGVQAFFLLDDLVPQGGATLALAGSHRGEKQRIPGHSSLRALLKNSEDLEQDLRRAGVAIVEMSGRAGDVFLMDMRVLHTPSINASRNVRMMATARFLFNA